MITEFALGWLKSPAPASKAFKLEGARSLFEDYSKRIGHYSECKIVSVSGFKREAGTQLWICHTGSSAKMLSSENLSPKLEQLRDTGIRKFTLAIGGPDGFSNEDIEKLRPEFQWSFGPMTLAHELAAVVAAEQIYRAWTILHNLPYHKGH